MIPHLAAAMRDAADGVRPSAGLKERVMQAIAAEVAMGDARAVLDAAITEREWEWTIRDFAGQLGWWCHHAYDSRRSAPGWPDLVLVHPTRHAVLFAELKTEKGRLSNAQLMWIGALRNAGLDVRIWRPSDWPEVEATLKGAE